MSRSVVLVGRLVLACWIGAAHADWVIPPGTSVQLGGGTTSLSCADLLVQGSLSLGAGGAISDARNVTIASTGVLALDGGNVTLAQNWINQGTVNTGGGQVLRAVSQDCTLVGQSGPITVNGGGGSIAGPQAIPALDWRMLFILGLVVAWLGWRSRRVKNLSDWSAR